MRATHLPCRGRTHASSRPGRRVLRQPERPAKRGTVVPGVQRLYDARRRATLLRLASQYRQDGNPLLAAVYEDFASRRSLLWL